MTRIFLFLAVFVAWGAQAAAQAERWAEVKITGEASELGVFDPSVAADPEGGLVMSYSGVAPSKAWPRKHDRVVSTYLARSAKGARWRRIAPLVLGYDTPGAQTPLGWQSEVSALAVDSKSSRGRRWKLAAHRFPLIRGKRAFEHGWIALREAASPEELARAREVKLLVGRGYRHDPKAAPPSDAPPVIYGHKAHGDLSWCMIFTEPALLARGDALYLATTCAEWSLLRGILSKVVLFKCAAPCQPRRRAAWRYLGVLLGRSAVRRDGVLGYTAAAFAQLSGADYLIATPIGRGPFKRAYHGCRIHRITDLERAKLGRAALTLRGAKKQFRGACAFHAKPPLFFMSRLRLTWGRPYFTIQALARAANLAKRIQSLPAE
ncbi:MAG: hypothetical protein MRY74_11895 [Neomegalonema sp.]|nr:hypothetical protein [Neomegalonema sp.]